MARTPKVSTKPGASIYPIRPGAVFRLTHTKMKMNKLLNCELEHHVCLWVLGVGKKEKKRAWKDRTVRLVRFEFPVAPDKRTFFIDPIRTNVRFENVCRTLNKGYEELPEVPFYYNKTCWRKFYKTIGYPD